VDCVEEFTQILIEEDINEESDLEYCNFNYEFKHIYEILIYKLVRNHVNEENREAFEAGIKNCKQYTDDLLNTAMEIESTHPLPHLRNDWNFYPGYDWTTDIKDP
jgi:hypothetical protein